MAEDPTLKNTMESNKFSEVPTIDITDDASDSPQTEDIDEGPDFQAVPGSSQAADAQHPLLHAGRKKSKKKATLPSRRSRRQLNQSRASAPKPPTSGPSLMIYSAIASCQKKTGISMQAVKKMVANMGYDMVKKKHYFLRALRNMVTKGQIWQIKGTGATGSFKINPDPGEKNPPKKKGKRLKNKKRSATSKNGQEAAKKQVKANVKKTCKRGKASSVQAAPSQVQV